MKQMDVGHRGRGTRRFFWSLTSIPLNIKTCKFAVVLCLVLSVIFSACNIETNTSNSSTNSHTVNRSFYHWKQSFHMEEVEIQMVEDLELKNLYLRFFDIIWQPPTGAIPTAIVHFQSPIPDSLSLIPCVYIENKVFQQLQGNTEIEDLAKKSATKIQTLLKKSGKLQITEIQMDCDWTGSTQLAYFHFLASFKKHFEADLTLSATIRLHQIKYSEKTGVPPVDKGMLMYYNMGKIKEPQTPNSILDNQIGRQYISSKTNYELPLDIALPIFEWGVWFHNDKFSGIFNDLNAGKLKEIGDFKLLQKNVYMLQQDTIAGNRYLRKGDVIRLEGVSAKVLKEAVVICRQAVNTEELNVSFYHWNRRLIEEQKVDFLKEIYEHF